MCFNPIHIVRPRYDENNPYHSKMLSLPCRKCRECRNVISSEYAFRAQEETTYCLSKGGLTFFNTFTYDDKFLPVVTMKNGVKFSTWNKKHVQNFWRSLRQFVCYYYDVSDENFKYLITTERGSNRIYQYVLSDGRKFLRKATERPHYHSIIWLYCASARLKGSLPKWCNGLTALKDTFPLAMKHFWEYGHLDDAQLTRSPAVAAKYCTKYMSKQLSDRLVFDDFQLRMIQTHNQEIDYKDMRPFSLFSVGIGQNFRPEYRHFTGDLKCNIKGRFKVSTIALPRYYMKKYLKTDVLDSIEPVKSLETHKATWTFKDGYVSSYVLDRNNTSSVPLHFQSINNHLGSQVEVARFNNKCFDFFNDVVQFIRNPEYFLCISRLYNKDICNDVFKIRMKMLNFFEVPSQVIVFGNNQYLPSAFVRRQMYSTLSYDEFYKWLDDIDKENQLDKSYLKYIPSSDPREEIVSSLNFAISSLLSIDFASIIDTIPIFFHYGVDINDDVLLSLSILHSFFADVRCIRNSINLYVNEMKYKNQLPQVLEKYPELFAPVKLDHDFNE